MNEAEFKFVTEGSGVLTWLFGKVETVFIINLIV